MYEFEEFEYEFSKIYKRLLRLELLLKKKIKDCSLSAYGNDVMKQFNKFFYNSKIYNKYKNDYDNKNYFINIRDDKELPNALKFINIINILTLRHLLHFIFTEEAFRIKEIAQKFYTRENVNFIELRNAKTPLINLRNYIAHFDFKKYKENKNEYLYSLLLYEINIGCSLGKYDTIPSDLGYKPSLMQIIKKIYELVPELFKKDVPHSRFPYNKDRMIVDMYEDIAVLNGWEYSELKSQWDVIRSKYAFNQKKAKAECLNDLDTDDVQISLFNEAFWS